MKLSLKLKLILSITITLLNNCLIFSQSSQSNVSGKTYQYISIFSFILLIILLINNYRSNRINKKKNKQLEYRNSQIEKQNDMILEQAEELLQTNQDLEQLSIVAEKTNNAVIIMNKEGNIQWVNESFSQLTGYNLKEFVDIYGINFLSLSSHASAKEIAKNCIHQKESISYNSSFICKNGDEIWLNTNLTPILSDKNEIKKLVAILSDITPIKLAERKIRVKNGLIEEKATKLEEQTIQLVEANLELKQEKQRAEIAFKKLKNAQSQLVSAEKMVSLGQLTAGVAHEINNPINYINSSIDGLSHILFDVKQLLNEYEHILSENNQAAVQSLKQKYEYNELIQGFEELTSNIKTGISRTKEIITSLRTFSRVDDSVFVTMNLSKIIKSAIVLVGPQNSEKITITTDFTDLPEIECLPGKLSQVFINIIVNAIQSIENIGTVKISTKLHTHKKHYFAIISISDNGIGIPTEIRSRIFEPFYTTKEIGKGTGLGLSISYGIIQKHKGHIELESKENKGTTFKIFLPLNQTIE